MMSLGQLSSSIHAVYLGVPGLATLAIPWFHLRAPLDATQKYFLGDEASKTLKWIPRWLAALARAFLLTGRILVETAKLFFLRLFLPREWKSSSADVVSKTWMISDYDDGTDFYYGDLAKELELFHLGHLFVSADVRAFFSLRFVRKMRASWKKGSIAQLCLVPLGAPLQMYFQQWRAAFRLFLFSRGTADPFVRAVARRAFTDVLSKSTHFNGLYFWMGKEIVRQLRPKIVMTLYEGHAWERCLCWGVKSVAPELRTVGYQHTVLLPYSLGQIRPLLPSEVMPDLLLCTGERTTAILKKGFERRNVKIIPFGTARRRSALAEKEEGPRPFKKTLLVLPEGSRQETSFLFRYGLAFAERCPDYSVLLRCHPFLNRNSFLRSFQKIALSFKNVSFSSGPIEDDYRRSSAVLYCSSSAVLYAILYGVKPFYVTETKVFDEDVLFELEDWKVRVNSVEELADAVEKYEREKEEKSFRAWRSAKEYIESYSTPVSFSSVERFLAECGWSRTA